VHAKKDVLVMVRAVIMAIVIKQKVHVFVKVTGEAKVVHAMNVYVTKTMVVVIKMVFAIVRVNGVVNYARIVPRVNTGVHAIQ
jgi:hypothetical protein